MQLSKNQVNAILQNAPVGVDKTKILDGLVQRGYTLEGVDMNTATQNLQKQATQTTTPPATTVPPTTTPAAETTKPTLAPIDAFSTIKETGNIVKDSGKQIAEGFKQTKEGVNNPSVIGGARDIVAGTLNEAGGTIRGIFSPIEAAVKDIAHLPGAQQALDAIKNHIINPTSEAISNIPAVQKFVMANPNAESNISNAIAIAGTLIGGGEAKSAVADANAAIGDTLAKIKSVTPPPPPEVLTNLASKVKASINDAPSSIMNKVARLNPSDANMFQNLAGKTHGEYLAETGNFGTPEQIITKEAQKFTDSLNSVDTALAKLPGKFTDGSITDALSGLVKKAQETSGDNIKSPFLGEVLSLQKAHENGGLTMEQINNVKRLYERNVKLGYNKLTNGTQVEQATNVDNALRKWQVNEATNLGLENLPELNKQTQIAKFMVDKLGAKLTGQSGLNAVTLTDWIMLSGGNPTAVAGLLVKKVFSSKAIQAKIASLLSKGESIPTIEAKLGLSKVKQLPAPKEGAIKSQNFVPIESLGEGTVESPAQQIRRQPIISDQKLLPARGETSAKIEAGTITLSEAGTIIKSFEKKFGVDEVKNAIKNRTTIKTMSQALSEKKSQGLIPSKQAKPRPIKTKR